MLVETIKVEQRWANKVKFGENDWRFLGPKSTDTGITPQTFRTRQLARDLLKNWRANFGPLPKKTVKVRVTVEEI